MQNAECKISFPFSVLIPLRGLFFLAARHSANKFALCSRSAASVPFSVLRSPFSSRLAYSLQESVQNLYDYEKISCLFHTYPPRFRHWCARLLYSGRSARRVVSLSCEISCNTACYTLSDCVGSPLHIDRCIGGYYAGKR